MKIGTARRLKDALLESEDFENLNTSFVERLNLYEDWFVVGQDEYVVGLFFEETEGYEPW